MNCPWDACSLCRLTACEITLVALLVLPGTSDCIPCQARQLGTSRPSSDPPPPQLRRPSLAPFCCFISEPTSLSQWFVPAVSPCSVFLPSSPHHSTFFARCCFLTWTTEYFISYSGFPLLPIQLFLWNPSFVSLGCFFCFFFLKHIYTKSWCVALSADIRKVSFQCARLI